MVIVYLFVIFLFFNTIVFCRVTAGGNLLESSTNLLQRRYYGILLIFEMVCIILVVGLRHESVGIDTWNYANHYRRCFQFGGIDNVIVDLAGRNYREPLYWFCLYFFSRLNAAEWVPRFFFAVLSCIPIGMLIFRQSRNYLFSLFVFFAFSQYAFIFTAIRQATAIAFIAYAMLLIHDQKPIKAMVMIALAMGFHITAIVFAPAVFFGRIKVNWKTILLFVGMSSIVLSFRNVIMSVFKESRGVSYDDIAVGGKAFSLFLIATAVLQYIYGGSKDREQSHTSCFYFWMSAMNAVVYLFARTSPVYLRMALYYQIAQVVAIPNLLESIKEPVLRCVGYLGYTVAGVYFFFTLVCYSYDITPYMFFWQ